MPANIVVPEVGESIVDARVAKWLRKEGDPVSAGDPLVELETDKIDVEVSAPQAGVLKRIDRKDGEDVKVGEVLGVIEEGAAAPVAAATPVKAAAPASAKAGTSEKDKEKPRSTPAARKVAEEHEVDLTQVRGTGDAGRVMKRDVEQAAASGGNRRNHPHRNPRKLVPFRRSPRSSGRRRLNARKSACGCRSAARRSPNGWSRRRARQPC
jgi:2-oxoglutarate dehydrogenase E2 component (dihydrolipoamide succinyltransferase)